MICTSSYLMLSSRSGGSGDERAQEEIAGRLHGCCRLDRNGLTRQMMEREVIMRCRRRRKGVDARMDAFRWYR